MEPWTVKQLKQEMDKDLLGCEYGVEWSMCQRVWIKTITRFAEKLGRKLTPGEQSILDSL